MAKVSWWQAGRPHWSGRTIALFTGAGVLVAAAGIFVPPLVTAQTGIGNNNDVTPATTEDAQTAGTELCSPNSEGDPLVGWGPERPVYTDTAYPDSLTFNSTYKNAELGDERNWVRGRATGSGDYGDLIEVHDGGEYQVNAYFRLDGPGDQVAEAVRYRLEVPGCAGHRIGVSGSVTAENTYPLTIWDGAEFWARDNFTLTVVPDSAIVESNAHPGPEGLPVSTQLIVSDGLPLPTGAEGATMAPGYGEAVYVTLRVRAAMTD